MSDREDVVEHIGRYRILRLLGSGGMADVFLAQREGSSELCVLKRLNESHRQHENARRRLQREAHVSALLDHPHIARLLGAGEEDQGFCVAYELVRGCTLEELRGVSPEPLPLPVVRRVMDDLLDGLGYAHALCGPGGEHLQIVHRDVTPRNIMIDVDGVVKLIDFGVARAKLDQLKTAPGMIVGTLIYMSPEQALAGELDHRSDLYSLGALFFELVAGRPLVSGSTVLEILEAVVSAPVPRASELAPALPAALDLVLARALAKAPEDRFPDADSLRRALDQAGLPAPCSTADLALYLRQRLPEGLVGLGALEEVPAAGPPPELTRAAPAAVLPELPVALPRIEPTPTSTAARRRTGRRPRWPVGLVAASTALLVAALVWVSRQQESAVDAQHGTIPAPEVRPRPEPAVHPQPTRAARQRPPPVEAPEPSNDPSPVARRARRRPVPGVRSGEPPALGAEPEPEREPAGPDEDRLRLQRRVDALVRRAREVKESRPEQASSINELITDALMWSRATDLQHAHLKLGELEQALERAAK